MLEPVYADVERACWQCGRPTRWRFAIGVLAQCSLCREREESEAAGYQLCPPSCPWCGGAGCVMPRRSA